MTTPAGTRTEIHRNACATILRRVGVAVVGSPVAIAEDLADAVGMRDRILEDPLLVAAEVTAYLDDLARDP